MEEYTDFRLFEQARILFIESSDIPASEREAVKAIIKANGVALFTVKPPGDSHYQDVNQLTHLIASLVSFPEYKEACEQMLPLVTPAYITESYALQRLLPIRAYSPDPCLFLKEVFISCSASIPPSSAEALYAAVRAVGGQFMDDLTKFTTHLVTMDVDDDKSLIAQAYNHEQAGLGLSPPILIVLPQWIDDCLLRGERVDEQPYILPGAEEGALPMVEPRMTPGSVLEGKIIYLSLTLELTSREYSTYARLVSAAGGTVASLPVTEGAPPPAFLSAAVLVTNRRTGSDFRAAIRYNKVNPSSKMVVANVDWLLRAACTQTPIISGSLAYYPQPCFPPNQPLPFSGLVITITNYFGDARPYLARLITLLGGKFTKTMKQSNTHLVACSGKDSKKVNAALKWGVQVVNHVWVEDCFRQLQRLDEQQPRFQCGYLVGVLEQIGRAVVDEGLVEKSLEDLSNSESTQAVTAVSPPVPATPARAEVIVSPPSSRKAKVRAVEQLHSVMDDLNFFQKQSRSKRDAPLLREEVEEQQKQRQAKRVAEEEEVLVKRSRGQHGGSTSPERALTAAESVSQSITAAAEAKGRRAKPYICDPFDFTMVFTAVDLELSRTQLQQLARMGIKVTPLATEANVVVCTKVVRTEKFFCGLGNGLKHVLHPSFVRAVIDYHFDNEEPRAPFSVEAYSLDMKAPQLVHDVLGDLSMAQLVAKARVRHRQGGLFKDLALSFSKNLPSGESTISKVLAAHGCTQAKCVRVATIKDLRHLMVENNPLGPRYIFCAAMDDTTVVKGFKRLMAKLNLEGIVIQWEWIVQCMYQMTILPFDGFLWKDPEEHSESDEAPPR